MSTPDKTWVFNPIPNTTYYWRVDTVTASNTIPGSVWKFTTGEEIFDSALVSFWKLDQTNGLTASDVSLNSNHGTLWGGATWATGRKSGALQFDGVDDHVAFELGPALSGPTDFTVSAWIKTRAATDQVILQQRDWRGYNGEYQFRVKANGTLNFWLYGNEAYQFDVKTTATINDGKWHFVSAVRAGKNGYIYIDGKPAPSASASGTVRDLSSGLGVVLGRDNRDGNQNFNGMIDEVRLYKRALTGAELATIRSSYITAPVLSVQTPVPGGAAVVVSWPSENGQTYNVETKPTLGTSSWGLLMPNIQGTGGIVKTTNYISSTQIYFRVVTQ